MSENIAIGRRSVLTLLFIGIMFLVGVLLAFSFDDGDLSYPEIHCKHFFYGYPTGTPETNDLIIRDIYALSSNDETKLADWVAYRLDRASVTGEAETQRVWKADPWLADDETLEPDDYDGAYDSLGLDRGHQAPLASFSGTDDWADTNYLSNITPQKSALNRGLWKVLEGKVRNLAESGHIVYVMTGPLFEKEMLSLPSANEHHIVPSGYWKIIIVQTGKTVDSIRAASFVFDQDTPSGEKVTEYLCTINEIETRSGLDFLRGLPDDTEESIENDRFQDWAFENFDPNGKPDDDNATVRESPPWGDITRSETVPDLNGDRIVDLLDLVLVAVHFGDKVPADDVTVYVTKTGSKYHRADCWNLNRCAIPVRKGVAEICGYTPCGGCNP